MLVASDKHKTYSFLCLILPLVPRILRISNSKLPAILSTLRALSLPFVQNTQIL
jgi:hypothetical protein